MDILEKRINGISKKRKNNTISIFEVEIIWVDNVGQKQMIEEITKRKWFVKIVGKHIISPNMTKMKKQTRPVLIDEPTFIVLNIKIINYDIRYYFHQS